VVSVVDLGEIREEEEMPRPCKGRRIRGSPDSSYFKPAGIKND